MVLVQDCHRVSWVILGLGDGYGDRVRVRDREPGHLRAFAGNPGHPCPAWDDRLLDSGCSHVSICMGLDSRAACSCNCGTDWFLASLPVGSCFLHLLGVYLCAWGSLGCRVTVNHSLSSWIPF